MYQIDFNTPIHVHFIGIGGISMSGLAEILLDRGFTVSGSDAKESPLTEHLVALGATVGYPQSGANITEGIDVVVYTAAISADNPEFVEVKRRQIPMLTRAEMLGQIMQNYGVPIAISGTHGKTTTTSMVSEILMAAKADPTLSIGGILPSIQSNIRVGASPVFVTEACEYTNSFLSFSPKISLILNVEEDHMDFFHDIHEIRDSFHQFAQLLPEDGTLIINGDIPELAVITEGLSCHVVTYGATSDSDYYPEGITYDEKGNAAFTLCRSSAAEGHVAAAAAGIRGTDGGETTNVSQQATTTHSQDASNILGVPGEHNVMNALAAIALADILGLDRAVVKNALAAFTGTERRFEYKGDYHGVTIIDDYAHHPTEIRASLAAAARYPHKKLWCVFQPHTYTRTQAFLSDFADALMACDHLVLADIYAAREVNTIGITSQTLQQEIVSRGGRCDYFPSFSQIQEFFKKNCAPGDMLITMGAGDVVNIGENLLAEL